MKSAYRVFAYIIAAEVVVQAAAIAFAVFGLTKWIEDGGTLNKASMESEDTKFTGLLGFIIHGMNGSMLIPLIALVFFIISFFAKIPGGVKWAGYVLAAVVVQVLLGMTAHGVPALGALHGILALVLFGLAVMAGKRVSTATTTGSLTHEGAMA